MNPVVTEIGTQLVHLVLPTLATAIASLAVGILQKKLKVVGIELDDKQATRLRTLAHDAILRTEEASRRDPTMSPTEKADYAERTILEQAPDVQPADARHWIDVMLPMVRAKGMMKPPVPTLPMAPVGRFPQ